MSKEGVLTEIGSFHSLTEKHVANLELYLALLEKWNKQFNLVGDSTLDDPWQRHVLDAAQILPLLPERTGAVIDIGTGAGIPGLILSLMGVEQLHLVESNGKKIQFLQEVIRQTGVDATVHYSRIEEVPPFPCRVVTARALAPLDKLLAMSAPFFSSDTVGIFLKGKAAEEEIMLAKQQWDFTEKRYSSRVKHGITETVGTVVCISSLEKKDMKKVG